MTTTVTYVDRSRHAYHLHTQGANSERSDRSERSGRKALSPCTVLVNKGGKWIPLQAHCFSVLVDAIRINQQEAIHDTITRAKPQQKRSHCIAKGVRKAP